MQKEVSQNWVSLALIGLTWIRCPPLVQPLWQRRQDVFLGLCLPRSPALFLKSSMGPTSLETHHWELGTIKGIFFIREIDANGKNNQALHFSAKLKCSFYPSWPSIFFDSEVSESLKTLESGINLGNKHELKSGSNLYLEGIYTITIKRKMPS